MTQPTTDALVFGLAHLNGPKAKLSFGGEGAQMAITERAEAALQSLLATGYAEAAEPSDSIPGRRHYQGTGLQPHLGALAQERGLSPFDSEHRWIAFERTNG
jgi:hypothetical protein